MTSLCHPVEITTTVKDDEIVMKRYQQQRKGKRLTLGGENVNKKGSALDWSHKHLEKGRAFLMENNLVEVKQVEKGLRGSWHRAVVVEVLRGRRVVEYEDLMTPDGLQKLRETVPFNEETKLGFKPLRATVEATRSGSKQRIRPRPPTVSSPATSWVEGTWVDCLYEDAWWEGVLKEDIISAGSKTAVLVFFPDENDISKHDIDNLRLTQDWDETSGTWNRRVPLSTVPSDVKVLEQFKEVPNKHEDRDVDLNINENKIVQFRGCGMSQSVANITSFVASGSRSPHQGEQAAKRLQRRSLKDIDDEGEENIYDVGNMQSGSIEQEPSSNTVNTVTELRQMLREAGWTISRSILQTGKSRWFYRSPGGPIYSQGSKFFSTLSSALSYYAQENMKGSIEDSRILNSIENRDTSLASTSDQIKRTSCTGISTAIVLKSEHNTAPQRHAEHMDLTDTDAREYLKEMGWDVTHTLRPDGHSRWMYKAPRLNKSAAMQFPSLCGAVAEYNRRLKSNAQGAGITSKVTIGLFRKRQDRTKTRDSPAENLTSSKRHLKKTKRSAVKPEGGVGHREEIHFVPHRTDFAPMDETEEEQKLPRVYGTTTSNPRSSPRSSRKRGRHSSSEGPDVKEDIHRGSSQGSIPRNLRKRFADVADSTGDVKSMMVKAFGSFAGDVSEGDLRYLLDIHILNLKKEHLRIFVENENLIIEATYCSESISGKFSTICSGTLSCRLTLPDDARQELVTATQLKPGILRLTIPKCTKKRTKFEIPIR